ncbi:MAG: permease-like cell division protein FtsX [Oscillospiraceae bacterium]|nr:permease-like cell division protein FtsX [Oscillospiraceae bacterium]
MKNIGYFFSEGCRNMLTHGFMSFAAVGITVACLLIMGTFSLVAYNANVNLEILQRENAVIAFVDDALSDEEARAIESRLAAVPGVADVTFVSRQEARDAYVANYDENGLYSELSANVFRHRYVLHITDQEQMRTIAAAVEDVEGIDKVRADEAITTGFITVRNVAQIISFALIAVLLVVSLFIISNTIKLTTFDRRDEIAIMKMVGATDGFIRWPFVFEGMIFGLVGSVVAFGLQALLYAAIADGIAGNDTLQLIRIVPFGAIWAPVAVFFLAVGMLVGIAGSLMAIHRFLRV